MSENLRVQRLIGARPSAGVHHSSSPDREVDDFYATPPESIRALLLVETFDGPVWEPACGQGHISRILEESGLEVISTELVDRGYGEIGIDFLMEWQPRAPNIITNPPFKLSSQFVRNALKLTTGKVAMLLKIGFLEGIERADLFDASPLARVWVFRRRQSFLKSGIYKANMNGKGGMIAYAWFVWEHGYQGKPTLGWI